MGARRNIARAPDTALTTTGGDTKMDMLAQIVGSIAVLGWIVCYIWVLIKMFQKGQTLWAIVSLVLCCCGLGHVLVFIFGWVKAKEWNIMNVMMSGPFVLCLPLPPPA
jgi:hypothetical protein